LPTGKQRERALRSADATYRRQLAGLPVQNEARRFILHRQAGKLPAVRGARPGNTGIVNTPIPLLSRDRRLPAGPLFSLRPKGRLEAGGPGEK